MEYRTAQVILTECNWLNPLSRLISASEGSPITHSFIVTGQNLAVEASWPRVHKFSLSDHLSHMTEHDQAYVVLDIPELTDDDRRKVAAKAESYIGRWYDIGQALLYALTHKFWNDGTGTLLCSRLVTAAFYSGLDLSLFPEVVLTAQFADSPKLDNLRSGYATPADLLRSKLTVVGFSPSSRFHSVEELTATKK